MTWLIVGVLAWLFCGWLHFGLYFAYFQRGYPTIAESRYKSDWVSGFILSLLGPISLLSGLLFVFLGSIRGYQGFKWR